MLNELQEKLLEMITWLDKFIRDNNLRYYALGGTLLGAVRHNGFIPWDDDIDIGLPRADYEKLIKLLDKPIDHYVIESPKNTNNDDFIYSYAKLYDTNTTMIEKGRYDIKRGVFIDIFPLDGLGQSQKEGLVYYKKIDKLNILLVTRTIAIKKSRAWYKNMAIIAARCIPSFMINERKLCSKIDSLCSMRDFDNYSYVGNLCGVYRTKETYYKSILGSPTEYDFENIKILGPEHADEFLTQMYGDWRQLPPEEKRGIQHIFTNIDFKTSYLKIEN